VNDKALYTITVNNYHTVTLTLHYSLTAGISVLYRPIFHILLALVKCMVLNALEGTKNPSILGSSSSSILHVIKGLIVNTAGILRCKEIM
jgi:hypothetical protein